MTEFVSFVTVRDISIIEETPAEREFPFHFRRDSARHLIDQKVRTHYTIRLVSGSRIAASADL